MNRRTVLASGAAAAAMTFAGSPAFAAPVSRTFKAYRGNKHLGGQVISFQQNGSSLVVDLHTRLKGRILMFPLDYDLRCREIWRDGVVQKIESQTRENDKTFFVKANRVSDGLEVASTKFNGVIPGTLTTSSIFLSDLAQRNKWISTQSGRPLKVSSTNRGTKAFETLEGSLPCTHYHFAGELKIKIDGFFDETGELVGYEFDAVGSRARVVAESTKQKFRPLWG